MVFHRLFLAALFSEASSVVAVVESRIIISHGNCRDDLLHPVSLLWLHITNVAPEGLAACWSWCFFSGVYSQNPAFKR